MVRIAVLDDYQHAARKFADWSGLEKEHKVVVFDSPFASADDVVAKLAGFEVLCILRERTRFPRELIARLPKLRLMASTGMRNAAIDMTASKERGIVVCGTGSGSVATPELTIALMLAVARQLPVEDANMRSGHWQTTVGMELHGKTLALLGLGRLGGQVAKVASALGMRLIAWSQNLTEARAAECGAVRVDKDELFARADVLTVHLVLSERTRGLVGARELGLMQRSAILINTSRGPIVDEAALVSALEGGRLRGAGIDVYGEEPLPAGHPLRRAPRTVLTPHIGYVTEETYRAFYGETVENIEAWLAGKPKRVIGG
jgi:phosphoglycerate dehydrogenase-like enzyme